MFNSLVANSKAVPDITQNDESKCHLSLREIRVSFIIYLFNFFFTNFISFLS